MEIKDIDMEKGLILAEEFTTADIAIEQLAETLPTVVNPLQSKAEHDAIKKEIKPIKSLITSIEKRRKELKAPILDAGRLVDGEAKRLSGKLTELIAPLVDAEKEYKERLEREKEERNQYAQSKIDWMRDTAANAISMTADEIEQAIVEVTELDTSEKFYELTVEAAKLRDKTLNGLSEMLLMKKQQEQFQAQQKELEEMKARAQPEPVSAPDSGGMNSDDESLAYQLEALKIGLSEAQVQAIAYAIIDGELIGVTYNKEV